MNASTSRATRQTVTHLAIDDLTAHPGNIRNDLGDVTGLAASIRAHGILQPLVVTEHPDGGYVLLAGHRRLAAAKAAGLTRVPAVIRHDVTDKSEQLVLMLVENTQRRDLNPVERAEAYGALLNRGLTRTEVARLCGTTVATIGHYTMLLELDEDEREEIREGSWTVTDAQTLIRREREEERRKQRPSGGPVGRPKGRKTTPYFSDSHPLAKIVRGRCDHRGRPKVGSVGCGPCWEQVIREDLGASA